MPNEFIVYGAPATKGSTVSFMGSDGKIVTMTDSAGLATWTQAIGWAARAERVKRAPKPDAVALNVSFVFKKPASSKIAQPTVKPDIDKTLRALLDALTGVAYDDDAQVVEVHASKSYSTEAYTRVMVNYR